MLKTTHSPKHKNNKTQTAPYVAIRHYSPEILRYLEELSGYDFKSIWRIDLKSVVSWGL
jgi:hypothetical protein